MHSAESGDLPSLYRTLFEHYPDGVVVVDTDTARPIAFNDEAYLPLGYTRDEFAGLIPSDLDNASETQGLASAIACARREGRADVDTVFWTRQGARLDVHVTAKAVALGGETVCFYIWRDITSRRQADEQLEVLKYTIDQALTPAYWLAANGTLTYANDAACRALGYTHDELLRLTVFDINPKATPDRWKQVWLSLKTRGFLTVESEHRRNDGSVFPVALASVYFASRGREICTGFAVDITEQRRVQQERQRLETRLAEAQKLESIGRLAGGIAHDFNNMLAVISGHAEAALNGMALDGPLREDLTEIDAAARRSAELVRQLLAFARRQTVAPKTLDLNAVVSASLTILRRLIGEHINLSWVPGPGLWPVHIDPSQVDQLLANLVTNARDAIGPVGVLTISTENLAQADAARVGASHELGDYVLLTVQDNGSGMTSDVVEHLFEPFFTTKALGEGTGLGLSTVYGIVQQNHGFIDVKSAPGAGTTFRIGLPRSKGSVVQAGKPVEALTPGHETVLVVEDEAAILKACRRLMQGLGYTVLTAATPGEALACAEKLGGTIDLLISDVIMPEMNGRELADRLSERFPSMRRLFMSGYTADVIGQNGFLADGVSFLQKPFTVATLSAKVREALAGSSSGGAAQ